MAFKIKKSKWGLSRIKEEGAKGLLFACALVSLVTLGLVFFFLLFNSIPFFQNNDLWAFLTGKVWQPFSDYPLYGVLPLLMGTILVSLVAAIIAIPIGIGCTIYLSEIADPRVKRILKPIIEVLAGVPSVVYGLFAALVLSNWIFDIFHPVARLNALNGALILSVMMIPILVSVAEEAMNSVPGSLREASLALGATKWETIRRVILPASLPGIVAAIVLSIGRAVGETMAVIMATGSATQFTTSILDSVRPITAALAIDVPESVAGSMQYYSLFAVGLLLFAITFTINLVADYVLTRYKEAYT
jgi:phosphate ABC transporter permease protein PstC